MSTSTITTFAIAVGLATAGFVRAAEPASAPAAASAPQAAASAVAASVEDFCFIKGAPPSDFRYARIKEMKLAKGTYGSVREILDEFAENARKAGADAIINYSGSQRFGFWPWRMVRPVVRGTAIKWAGDVKPDCTKAGGQTLSEVLVTNEVTPASAPSN
jgi:hypothetical protein